MSRPGGARQIPVLAIRLLKLIELSKAKRCIEPAERETRRAPRGVPARKSSPAWCGGGWLVLVGALGVHPRSILVPCLGHRGPSSAPRGEDLIVAANGWREWALSGVHQRPFFWNLEWGWGRRQCGTENVREAPGKTKLVSRPGAARAVVADGWLRFVCVKALPGPN